MLEQPGTEGLRHRPQSSAAHTSPNTTTVHAGTTGENNSPSANATRSSPFELIPPAYRQRVTVALVLLFIAFSLRVILGKRIPFSWLIQGVYYNRTGEDGSTAFSVHVSPFPIWCSIYALVQFMLRRPNDGGRGQRR